MIFVFSQFKFLLELFCGCLGPLLDGPCFRYNEGDFRVGMAQIDQWLDGLIVRAGQAGVECPEKFQCGLKYVLASDREEGLAEEVRKKPELKQPKFTKLFADDGSSAMISWCPDFYEVNLSSENFEIVLIFR